jgi:hypothetical protein
MRAERLALCRIADALEALLIIMSDDDVTPSTPITLVTPEPTQPEQTLAQMVAACRSGLMAYKTRGGDHIALVRSALGQELKVNEMDEAQLIILLNNPELQ